jgi:hypothetical protein
LDWLTKYYPESITGERTPILIKPNDFVGVTKEIDSTKVSIGMKDIEAFLKRN